MKKKTASLWYLTGWPEKALRPRVSDVIWILSSDTDIICQFNQLFSNCEMAMLSRLASCQRKNRRGRKKKNIKKKEKEKSLTD